MGHPKKTRKKYSTPFHPWQKERIEEESVLIKDYGLKNKTEIHKMNSILKGFADQAKNLTASKTAQAEKEKAQLLKKLGRLGLISEAGTMDDILGLGIRNLLERRLQTIVFKKGMSRSISQARQFIVHGHVSVGNKKITSASYLVTLQEEPNVSFMGKSSFSNPDHPEIVVIAKKEPKPKKKGVKEVRRVRKQR